VDLELGQHHLQLLHLDQLSQRLPILIRVTDLVLPVGQMAQTYSLLEQLTQAQDQLATT
jgi:hypothetical protein